MQCSEMLDKTGRWKSSQWLPVTGPQFWNPHLAILSELVIEGIISLPCFVLAKYKMWYADSFSEVDEHFQDQVAVPEPGADNSKSFEAWVVPELSVSFVLVAMCIYHHL